MRVCLFEEHSERLEPLTLTRPVFGLRCGLTLLADKQRRHFGSPEIGAFVRPELQEIVPLDHAGFRVNDGYWLGAEEAVLVDGRWLPPVEAWRKPAESCIGLCDGEPVWIKLSAEQARFVTPPDLPGWLEHWKNTLPARDAGGCLIRHPWDLVERNAEQIRQDFTWWEDAAKGVLPKGVALVGPPERVALHPTARLDPHVVLDTTHGPVVIERNAVVSAFSRLEGPCHVGAGTHLHAATIKAGTSLGPCCRIGGEVEASIVQGYTNKAHEGFLGHSVVGTWVNLAAGTQTSDLRNDYRPVSVTLDGQTIPTGLTKVGCFLGDHVKTGLTTLLNTGTVVGAFACLLPSGGYAPRVVPSFASWWRGSLRNGPPLEDLLTTARIMMSRRGCNLSGQHRDLYTRLEEATAWQRKQALREWEQKQLRRTA